MCFAACLQSNVPKAPDLCSYYFQSSKEKEIGSRAAAMHFCMGSGVLPCVAVYLVSGFCCHLHLNIVTSTCSSLPELSSLPRSGFSMEQLSQGHVSVAVSCFLVRAL